MSPGVLQGGQSRRRRRQGLGWRRRGRVYAGGGWERRTPSGARRRFRGGRGAAVVVACLAVALLALLAFMSARAAGPSIHRPRIRKATAVANLPAPRSSYGIQAAAPKEQVGIHFKLGLTSGLLFDVRTGEVLWSQDPQKVLPIASLTKMMTALLVVTHSKPTDQVLITSAAVHFTGSGVGLLPLGKHVSELALLYGLLLPSGNDAAIALTQHVAGTRSRFITMMNARAQQMGLHCTHYNSVSGVVDTDNHSCAADLALIAHEVLEQPLLARIVSSRSAVVPFPIKGGKLFLYNNNPLLVAGYPGTDGVKTGYTTAAGACLVATARRGRAWLGVVLLHSSDWLDQAEELLNAGFAKVGA
jgi:serine-type D-Ala-D-Ala carboxypeptidase (penicillin-binding protein 5/6)